MPTSLIKNLSREPDYIIFDPYIHGTTAQTLNQMTKTDFQLIPVLDMLERYQIAPMVGELTMGGYSCLGKSRTEGNIVGAISFGHMNSGPYSLQKVTSNYTNFNPPSKEALKDDFRKQLNSLKSGAYSGVNLLLIYLGRLRHAKIPLNEVISEEEMTTLRQDISAAVQFYYFIQLLGTHIVPDIGQVEKASEMEPFKGAGLNDVFYSLLDFEHINSKIKAENINVKKIIENPTAENIAKALKLLELPIEAVIKSGMSMKELPVEFPIRQLFCQKTPKYKAPNVLGDNSPNHFAYFSRNISGYTIDQYLASFIKNKKSATYFEELGVFAKSQVSALEDRKRILDKLLDPPVKVHAATSERTLATDIPVVLLSESTDMVRVGDEYRSTKSLVLGEDIKLIATDNEPHRQALRSYVHQNQLSPVQVVLIDNLYGVTFKEWLPESIDSKEIRDYLTKAKKTEQEKIFYKLYQALDNLNEKRNQFKGKDQQCYQAVNTILSAINQALKDNFFGKPLLTAQSVKQFSEVCCNIIEENKSELEQHRGVLGILDTILTVMASLVILYPFVYKYQSDHGVQSTFFKTDSSNKVNELVDVLEEIKSTDPKLKS